MTKELVAAATEGPYGWLIVTPGLAEDDWRISAGALTEDERKDGLMAFPLFLRKSDAEQAWLSRSPTSTGE